MMTSENKTMNEVIMIINGVRYDAVMQNDFSNDCLDCAFFESCFKYETCCLFLGVMEGMIFKKSDKKYGQENK